MNYLLVTNGDPLSLSFQPEVVEDPMRYRADKCLYTEQKTQCSYHFGIFDIHFFLIQSNIQTFFYMFWKLRTVKCKVDLTSNQWLWKMIFPHNDIKVNNLPPPAGCVLLPADVVCPPPVPTSAEPPCPVPGTVSLPTWKNIIIIQTVYWREIFDKMDIRPTLQFTSRENQVFIWNRLKLDTGLYS